MKYQLLSIFLFLSCLFADAQHIITGYEYWFDNDYKNAVKSTANFSKKFDLSLDCSLKDLPNGIHQYYIRFKESSGAWTSVTTTSFYKSDLNTITGKSIISYQYWFDNNLTTLKKVDISPVQSANISIDIDLGSLSNSFHSLMYRFMDISGKYSSIRNVTFYKTGTNLNLENQIIGCQYWFDGKFINAVKIDIPTAKKANFIAEINTSALSDGFHSLFYRFIENTGKFSSIRVASFYKSNNNLLQDPQIIGFQYWFDNKYTNAQIIDIQPSKKIDLITDISTASLGNGVHFFFYRFLDNKGKFSSTQQKYFYKSVNNLDLNSEIAAYEYWFDDNYQKKIKIDGIYTKNFECLQEISLLDLTTGDHTFNIRFIGSDGKMSSTARYKFYNLPFLASPLNLRSGIVTGQTIDLIWRDYANNESGFEIERSTSSSSGFIKVGSNQANDTTYTDSLLIPSTVYYYRIRAYNNEGVSDYSQILKTATNCGIKPPVSKDVTACTGKSIPDLIATGSNVKWYEDVALTKFLFAGNTFTSGKSAVGIYNYYVVQTNGACFSSPSTVVLKINPTPVSPIVKDQTVCFGQTISNLEATGDNIKWFNNSALTDLTFEGNSFQTGKTQAGAYTWYVTQTINGCQSPLATVTFRINSLPASPTTNNQYVCLGQQVPALIAAGTNIEWYNDNSLKNLAYSGPSFSTGKTQAGTYTWFVVQEDANDCKSNALPVSLFITAIPNAPSSSDKITCTGNEIPDLEAIGDNIEWFLNDLLTISSGKGNKLATGKTNAGLYTYYATQSSNGCKSKPVQVKLQVNPSPEILLQNATNESNCNKGDGSISITANGDSPLEFSIDGTKSFSQTGTFNNLQTGLYDIAVKNKFSCITYGKELTISSPNSPSAPLAEKNAIYCSNDQIADLKASTSKNGTLVWFTEENLTNEVGQGNTFSPLRQNGTIIYFVVEKIDNCVSPPGKVSVTINATPDAPAVFDRAICHGDAVPELSASGNNIQWFEDQDLTKKVFSGNNFNIGKTSKGTYNYWVTASENNCNSVASQIRLIIDEPPNPKIMGLALTCLHQPELYYQVLAIEGHSYNWTIEGGLILSGQGTSAITVDWNKPGTGKIAVNEAIASCSIKSPEYLVKINEQVAIDNPVIVVKFKAVLICKNLKDAFISYQWYKNNEKIDGATNQFYESSQSLDGDYYVVTFDKNNCPIESNHLKFNNQQITGLNIYPVPVNGNINLELNDNTTGMASIKIINNLGYTIKLIEKEKINYNFYITLETKQLLRGIYLIELKINNEKRIYKKFIKI